VTDFTDSKTELNWGCHCPAPRAVMRIKRKVYTMVVDTETAPHTSSLFSFWLLLNYSSTDSRKWSHTTKSSNVRVLIDASADLTGQSQPDLGQIQTTQL
jgi:hypothetical protein